MDRTEGEALPRELLHFFHRIEPLKHLDRTGWVDRAVPRPETVAAHSWRLAIISWLVADSLGLDAGRALQLALLHDIAEVITGDLTPFHASSTSAEERAILAAGKDAELPQDETWRLRKVHDERAALQSTLKGLPPALVQTLAGCWEEYEQVTTPEAMLVSRLDKFEAYLQGTEYLSRGLIQEAASLRTFQAQTRTLLTTGLLHALLEVLEAETQADTGARASST